VTHESGVGYHHVTVHEYVGYSLVNGREDSWSHGDVGDKVTAESSENVRISGNEQGEVGRRSYPSIMSVDRLSEGNEREGSGGRTHVDPLGSVVHHALDLVREVAKVTGEDRGRDNGSRSRH
jgi:hypothetical protein